MNGMTKIGLYLLLLLCPVALWAQKAKVEWNTTVHDFGDIQENKGKVSYTFQVTNCGDAPLLIRHVESSCGCAITDWSRRPISPGKTAGITVTFNPQNREGKFIKKITVYTNATTPNHLLKITGNILIEELPLSQQYPFKAGNLRYDKDSLRIDTNRPYQSIHFLNTGKKIVTITRITAPELLRVNVTFKKLRDNEKGYITITPHADYPLKSTGKDTIILYTNEGEEIRIRLFKQL